MLLPPHTQRTKKRPKFMPLVGNNIFGSGRMIRVCPSLNDPVLLKYLEAGRQGVRANSRQRALEVLKLARTLKNEIAQDQHCPAVADNIQRPRYRTELCVVDSHQRYRV